MICAYADSVKIRLMQMVGEAFFSEQPRAGTTNSGRVRPDVFEHPTPVWPKL
jgi:hypothetical protein